MAILPTTVQDLLDFADAHDDQWVNVAAQIGLSTAQATLFRTTYLTARSEYNNQLAAEEAKLAATMRAQNAVRDLRRVGGDTLRLIKAFAENQPKPNVVYETALIPAPQPPSPVPPPAQPTNLRAVLNPEGSITLRWKAANPRGTSGTVYIIQRRLAGQADFTQLNTIGVKAYTDGSLPAGTPSAQYVITGKRGDSTGMPSSPFVVMFGVGGPGVAGVGRITAQYTEGGTTNARTGGRKRRAA